MKTLTLKQLIEKSGHINPKLIRATVAQFGGWERFTESAADVTNHGINGGFGGFVYCSETCKFFTKNRTMIMELAEEQAQQIGDGGALEMIQSFNCFSSGNYPNRKPDYTQSVIAEAIYKGNGEEATQIQNGMAWFAGEEVCRAYVDLLEQED
jgi:hypothetical protein